MPIIDDTGPHDAAEPDYEGAALLIGPDADPATLTGRFGALELIAVAFPKSADGRGFSLARRLRHLGYSGRLRAKGWLLPDQYAYARACGFDDVAVDAAHFARHGAEAWTQAATAPVAPPFRARQTPRAAA
ncbi:MAG: DUF934 domain-containing protein [Alphaproteobacteria bacterium]|nr:DUF934 domain-containing protein [Alphaproteobacteria bacterium]